MESLITIIAVVIAVVAVLKLLNMKYVSRERKNQEKELNSFSLLAKVFPSKKYKKISKRASVPNSPVRTKGDFLDFILEVNDDLNEKFIENNLFNSKCGVLSDE